MKPEARKRRKYWVSELAKLSGSFGDDSNKMIAELRVEISQDGTDALLDHLRLCGAMPEFEIAVITSSTKSGSRN